MSRVDRRMLAWILSLVLGCLGVVVAVWDAWPGPFPIGGGLAAVSVGFPSLAVLPFVIANLVLSVIARRRGGQPASIGSACFWMLGSIVVLTLAVSLMPPAVERVHEFRGLHPGVGPAGGGPSLPVQLVILAILTFAVIGNPATPCASRDTR